MRTTLLCFLYCSLFLTACGGGGSSNTQDTPPTATPVPEPTPTPEPAPEPTPEPTPEPDPEPTPEPDPEPTPEPDPEPTPEPDPEPTPEPDPEPTPEPDPEPTPEPDPEPTPEPTPQDKIAPTNTLLYPTGDAMVFVDKITIQGYSEDESGVDSVSVNGITALNDELAVKLPGRESAYYWRIDLDVPGDIPFPVSIETTDIHGNTASQVIQVQKYKKVPGSFFLDSKNNRLIGRRSTEGFVFLDLETNTFTDFQIKGLIPYTSFTYMEPANTLSIAELSSNSNTLTLSRFDLENQTLTEVGNAKIEYDNTIWGGPRLLSHDYVAELNASFIAVIMLSKDDDRVYPIIYRLNHNDNSLVTVIDGKTTDGTSFTIDDIKANQDGFLVLGQNLSNSKEGLFAFNLDGSIDRFIGDFNSTFSIDMILDPVSEFAYSVRFNDIYKTKIESGETILLSDGDDYPDMSVLNSSSHVVNVEEGELWTYAPTTGGIVAIDLETGERKQSLRFNVGEGFPVVSPRDIAYDRSRQHTYVIDNYNSTRVYLSRIEAPTGYRRRLLELNELGVRARDIKIDHKNDILYILGQKHLITYKLDTKESSILSSERLIADFEFSLWNSLAVDADNKRVFISENLNKTIMAVNPETREASLISRPDVKGEGIEMATLTDIAFDPVNNELFTISQKTATVYKVDVGTGNREIVFDACPSSNGIQKLYPDSGSIQELTIDLQSRKLFATATDILEYDLDGKTCLPIENTPTVLGFVSAIPGQILYTHFGTVFLLDVVKNERVIISR